jgi:hypothetical protein
LSRQAVESQLVPTNESNIIVSINKNLDIEKVSQLRLVKNQDTLNHDDGSRVLLMLAINLSGVDREVIYRNLHRLTCLQISDVLFILAELIRN